MIKDRVRTIIIIARYLQVQEQIIRLNNAFQKEKKKVYKS